MTVRKECGCEMALTLPAAGSFHSQQHRPRRRGPHSRAPRTAPRLRLLRCAATIIPLPSGLHSSQDIAAAWVAFFPRYRCRLGCILLKIAAVSLLTGLVGSVEAAPMVEKIEERAELNQVRERSHLCVLCICTIASACLVSRLCPIPFHDCALKSESE